MKLVCESREDRDDLALVHNVLLEATFTGRGVVRAGRMIEALAATVAAFDAATPEPAKVATP